MKSWFGDQGSGVGANALTPIPDPRSPNKEWLPWIALAAFAILWLARWSGFPLSLDPYYHLLIARQIVDAGGPITYEWWEHAPVGRPHLYPPVLHLLLALLLKIGVTPVAAMRAASVALPVALLVSLYAAARRLLGFRIACAALAAALVPFVFHLHCAITMAATLAMIELLWLVVALEEDRVLAAGCLLGLLGYTHLGLPGMALIAVVAHAMIRGAAAWRSLARASWGLLLPLPWWLHVLGARPGLEVMARWENTHVEIMPVLLAAAALGLWVSWRERGRLAWCLASWIGFLLLVPRHLYRWLNGEGMLPLLLLAGVGLARAVEWCAASEWPWWPRTTQTVPRWRLLAGGCVAAAVLVLGPTLVRTEDAPSTPPPAAGSLRWQWRWPDAAPWHLTGGPGAVRKEIDSTFVSPHLERLVALVQAHTAPREIIWSNAPYAIGLVAALAHRPMSSAMFNEVGAARPFDPIASAHLVVFFKLGRLPGWVNLADLRPYPLTPVAEDEVAILYQQAGVAQSARSSRAVMPLILAAAVLAVLAGLAAWDLARARQRGAIPL